MSVYEETSAIMFGGPAGTYPIENPFRGSHYEVMVLAVTTPSAVAASLTLAFDDNPTDASAVSFAFNDSGFHGAIYTTSANNPTLIPANEWIRVSSKCWLTVTGATSFLMVKFRREAPAANIEFSAQNAERATAALLPQHSNPYPSAKYEPLPPESNLLEWLLGKKHGKSSNRTSSSDK